jgi:phosphoribosylanthranilate isomerase
MTLIKICGLTSVEEALAVARMDVQVIGLVFAASRRRVSMQQAAEICAEVKKLPQHPILAGVFVNENPQTVNETARQCGLDAVQLSGDESFDRCLRINAPVIKAIHISDTSRSEDIIEHINGRAPGGRPMIYLLDTKQEGKYGGTGQRFAWDIARNISASYPVIIAGGLDPQNVGGLIECARPLGVDVSSGVESNGRKNIAKIQAFVQAVRSVSAPASGRQDLLDKYIVRGELNVT